MKTILIRFILCVILLPVLVPVMAFAQATPTISATVLTDKPDYQPGDSVIVTGSNWLPGETVKLVFSHSTVTTGTDTLIAAADNEGNIYNAQYLITESHYGETFILTALGLNSGFTAQTTFTDAFNVSSFTPSGGSVSGGTLVTISGNAINGSASDYQITFGGTPGTNVNRPDNKTLTVISPAHSAGGVSIIVKELSSGITKSVPGTFTYVSLTGTKLTVLPAAGDYNGTVNLSATLKTAADQAIAGQTIAFTLNGSSAGTATTNSSGVAALNVSIAGIDAGVHTGYIGASFAGNITYSSSNASPADLTINPMSTSLIVDNASGIYGGTADLSATLTAGGAALSGQTVIFYINGTETGRGQTIGGGKVTLHNIAVSGIDAGAYTNFITARFEAFGNYAGSTGSANLTIDQANTTLSVSTSTGTFGGTVDLSALLTSKGLPVPGEDISFSFNGTIYSGKTNPSGLATILSVPLGEINAGTHINFIRATFTATTNYKGSTNSGNLIVNKASAVLIADPVEAPYGSNVDLTATLTSSGTGIPNMTISFSLGGILLGTALTDMNGKATYFNAAIPNLGAGTYSGYITADFSPSGGNYQSASGSATLTIKELPTELIVKDVKAEFGSTVKLEATLTASGTPLSGRMISFTVNGILLGSSTTDAMGTASYNFSLSGINAGTYTDAVKAEFAAANGYAAAAATGDLTIDPAATMIIVSPATVTYGENVELSATLTSAGLPLSGMDVEFKLNGSIAGSGKTDQFGIAKVSGVSLSGIDAGSYLNAIEASFTATGNYASSSNTADLTIKQAPVNIVVEKASGPFGGKVNFAAVLTISSSGDPLSNKSIDFKLNGTYKGSAETDNNGRATLKDVSIIGLDVGTYNDYIEADFSPSGGNYASCAAKGQLEVTLAPTVVAIDKVTAVYGSKVNLSAKLTSLDIPLSGKTIEFTLNNVSAGSAVTDNDGAATKTDVDLAGISVGLHKDYIGASFSEASPYKGSTAKADLEITKAQTAVSVLAAAVQYSDQVTLTAIVTSPTAQGDLNAAGGSVEFKYQSGSGAAVTLSTVITSTIESGVLNFTYTFTCNFAPGTYKILAVFTPNDLNSFDGSSNAAPFGPLTVSQEDALAEYSGSQYFSTPSLTSAQATLTYSSTIKDIADDNRGEITYAKAAFKEGPLSGAYLDIVSSIKAEEFLPVFLIDASDKTTGSVITQPFTRTLSSSELSNSGTTFNIYTIVNGRYAKISEPTLITIGVPGGDNVSGGGFIVTNNSAGKYRSKAGSKANFGFTMKYNKTGKNIQGQANIIIRGDDGKIYQIKSNAINSLSAYAIKDMPGKAASFNTKANLTDITNPLIPIALGGSLSLSVEMYDDPKNNENDYILITLQDPSSGLLFSSNWNGTKTTSLKLAKPTGGGNIKVMSSSGLAKENGEEIIPTEYTLFQNYPNPFNPSTTIQYDLPEDSKVSVVIYNVLGRGVATLVDDQLPAGRHQNIWKSLDDHGAQVASGMYILRISAKSLSSERNLISTKKMMLIK